MDDVVELWFIRAVPDGLARITARVSGQSDHLNRVVAADDAERIVLAEWAAFVAEVTGYLPSWYVAGAVGYERQPETKKVE
jgi:hypothetical protein